MLPLAEASLISWTKHYRPDENTLNTAVSYYLKGELVCALLDLTIRRATNDQRSLDDVLRLLWTRFGDESGVPEKAVEAAAEEIAGTSLRDFFARSLHGTVELSYEVFDHVGLEPRFRTRESPNDKGGTPRGSKVEKIEGWLGIIPRSGNAIATVLEGSPSMAAGLYAEDEVIAFDGLKCDAAGLVNRCEDKKPGEVVRVTVFRRERLLEVPVTLGLKPADGVYLQRVERPTEAQKQSFQAWLGTPWIEAESALNAGPRQV